MNLKEAQISEIKNLNLIYVFTTDHILKNKSDKYIAAKVLYDEDKVFCLDYKSEYFGQLIKRLLSRYNKEKGKRRIILLGDLTKKLFSESSFAIIEDKKEFIQPTGILVNPKKNQIKGYQKYLAKVLKTILKTIKGYKVVNIDSIDGFNNKYVANYSVGNIKRSLYMLVFVQDDDTIDFRISSIDGTLVNISGSIKDNSSLVEINWYDDINVLRGNILYKSNENVIEEKLYKETTPIISKESVDTLLDEDNNIILFYMELCNLDVPKNVMKIDDNCYLLSESRVLGEDKDGVFYNNISCNISIFDEEVIIKYREKNGLNKYNDQIKVTLEENVQEFILKKIIVNNDYYVLVEKRSKQNGKSAYSYSVISLDGNISLSTCFDTQNKQTVNEKLRTFDTAKQYIKNIKGGN